jgi:hypothetical protein
VTRFTKAVRALIYLFISGIHGDVHMEMKRIIKWAITMIALASAQPTLAGPELPDNVYREKYQQTENMPDHLAYLSLMQNVRIAQEEVGTSANITHIRAHLSLGNDEAMAFLEYLLVSYDEMTTTNRTVTNRMLCTGNRPKYELNKAYAVLDVIDDIKDTNLRKHYRRALMDLGKESATELSTWLQVIKSDSAHHKYDHRLVFEHTDESVESVISTACNMIAAYQP